jgi:RimJ/RimL family protein N-acetyltransferase
VIIRGEKVTLRRMTADWIPLFYRWATESEATPFWYGEMVGEPVPTCEHFKRDFPPHYFDGSQPEKGRSFIIMVGRRAIGEINYNEIDRKHNSVDLDIIIAEDRDKGRGYGSDAVKTLARYLFREMHIEVCRVETVLSNPRAIRAYEKAGFKQAERYQEKGIEWVRLELRKKQSKVKLRCPRRAHIRRKL